ncbi:MAG: tRNA (adenosine(37)-N6)-threonylcarbamoyltransferase complex ATPase subunit type 1 TsaE [Verrucomicrobia bacterium]|nr:tRNA (adenosine(37)-N6)-threonylcarbamoyltransferase complex ATPase subunit type 1 TsaE [Verrucomicrobiota bacterium]
MATFISHSAEETERFAERFGRGMASGCVVGLIGDLGAGKTQFVRGFARGLDVTDRVHSPTFALLNIYAGGRLPLFHLDLYRLETDDQIVAAGLDQYFAPEGIAIVEWMDRWHSTLPRCYYQIEFEVMSENERRIRYDHAGA